MEEGSGGVADVLFTCFHPKLRSGAALRLGVRALTDKLQLPSANNNIDRPPMKKLKSRNIGHTVGTESLLQARPCLQRKKLEPLVEEWGLRADGMRERLAFDGRFQGCEANMKFLSKQLLSIKMTYICREHSVGGNEAAHTAQNRCLLGSIFLLFCCCLFNWSINGCISHRQDRGVFTVKWSGHLVPLLIYLVVVMHIFPSEHFVHLLSLVCTCPPYIPSCISPCQVSFFPSPFLLEFSDGMCSCCCLPFPIAVFASQHGDFGIAAELRCHGSELCCRAVHTWDLESLSVVFASPIYSTFLSGFLWCSRGYQQPSLYVSFSLSSQSLSK